MLSSETGSFNLWLTHSSRIPRGPQLRAPAGPHTPRGRSMWVPFALSWGVELSLPADPLSKQRVQLCGQPEPHWQIRLKSKCVVCVDAKSLILSGSFSICTYKISISCQRLTALKTENLKSWGNTVILSQQASVFHHKGSSKKCAVFFYYSAGEKSFSSAEKYIAVFTVKYTLRLFLRGKKSTS